MFDPSAPHIIILLIVVLLLFGSRRLPGAAKSLGESMHIFKKSVHGQEDNADQAAATVTTPPAAAQPPPALPPASDMTAQQLADLQRQVADLRKQNAGAGDSVPSSQQSA